MDVLIGMNARDLGDSLGNKIVELQRNLQQVIWNLHHQVVGTGMKEGFLQATLCQLFYFYQASISF